MYRARIAVHASRVFNRSNQTGILPACVSLTTALTASFRPTCSTFWLPSSQTTLVKGSPRAGAVRQALSGHSVLLLNLEHFLFEPGAWDCLRVADSYWTHCVFLTLLRGGGGGQEILNLRQAPNRESNDVNHTEPELFLEAVDEMQV
jgi:hypothetical protein